MLLESQSAAPAEALNLSFGPAPRRWGVDSEYGRLTDVMLAAPEHLETLPCNAVATQALADGLASCPTAAGEEHRQLVSALQAEGVRCHMLPVDPAMPDLSFTRDATVMTPWGLLALNPAVDHRQAEVSHVMSVTRRWGVPQLGRIWRGRIEGGDVCVLRPGTVIVGWSGERTNEEGVAALEDVFRPRGWSVIRYRFDPHFLHLDTQFTIVDRGRALACLEAMDGAFVDRLKALGLDLVPVTAEEVRRLGGNILSLGGGRVLSSADNCRLNAELERRGVGVIRVEVSQFVRCGGGIHCLTLPLARLPG